MLKLSTIEQLHPTLEIAKYILYNNVNSVMIFLPSCMCMCAQSTNLALRVGSVYICLEFVQTPNGYTG